MLNSLKIELEISEWLEDEWVTCRDKMEPPRLTYFRHSIEWYFRNIYKPTHWYSFGASRISALARPLSSFPSSDPEGE